MASTHTLAIRMLEASVYESNVSDTWDGWALFTLIFIAIYLLIAVSTFPYMWHRSGIPLIFLVFIVLFPPSFLFLIFYILLIQWGLMSSWWYAQGDDTVVTPAVVVVTDTKSGRVIERERAMAFARRASRTRSHRRRRGTRTPSTRPTVAGLRNRAGSRCGSLRRVPIGRRARSTTGVRVRWRIAAKDSRANVVAVYIRVRLRSQERITAGR